MTSVASGAGLTGGPITTSGTLSIAAAGVTNSMLANPALTVNAGSGLTGGGSVSLGGSTTLSIAGAGVTDAMLADPYAGVGTCAAGNVVTALARNAAPTCITAGTVTSVGSGAGLIGGPITTSGTLSIATAGVTNSMLANPALTVNAGSGLSGGGSVSLGGSTTLRLDPNFSGVTGAFSGSTSPVVSGTNTANGTYGQLGTTVTNGSNTYATGVVGSSTSAFGVLGTSSGSGGSGVFGYGTGSGGSGVEGDSYGGTGVSGDSISGGSGVEGDSNSGGTGVAGFSSGSGSVGVSGTADSLGVTGQGGSVGVEGNATAINSTGVFGQSSGSGGTGVGAYGSGSGSTGGSATGDSFGVTGLASISGGIGVSGYSGAIGSTGVEGNGVAYGVHGGSTATDGSGIGVWGGGDAWGVYAFGDLGASGLKSAVVALPDNRIVELYAMESPENWFEDFGSGELRDGAAEVALDPTFALTVNTGASYHVFLTPNGDCEGLYVAQKTATGFQVRELRGGKSNIAFDYRIVAKRRGYESVRMDQIETNAETVQALREQAQRRPTHHRLILPKPVGTPKAPPNLPKVGVLPAARAVVIPKPLAPVKPPAPTKLPALPKPPHQ